MVSPRKVVSPKEQLEIVALIEDGTQTNKGYSVAKVKWNGKGTFAIRYDGDNEEDKGFPTTTNGVCKEFCVSPFSFKYNQSRDFQKR